MVGYLFLTILALSLVAYYVGRSTARRFATESAGGQSDGLHSLPSYHGAFVAVWVGVPALVLALLWLSLQGSALDGLIWASLPADVTENATAARRELILSEIHNVSAGRIFSEPTPEISAAAERLARWQGLARIAMFVAVLGVMLLGLFFARRRLSARFRARNGVERVLDVFMIFCSTLAIATTLGIVVSLLYEAIAFFRMVPPTEFFFGLNWEPQIAIREDQIAGQGAFGAVPVFLGTLVIAVLAMLVAVPIGLFTAIYLNEYASDRFRGVIKPMLEILAGVPTVVYGFFAVLTVAPAIRQTGTLMGLSTSPNSALAAATGELSTVSDWTT